MQVEPLAIEGLWEITPVLRPDDRGVFLEAFKADVLSEAIGHPFTLKQMNVSVSSAGTVRGIHFADETWIRQRMKLEPRCPRLRLGVAVAVATGCIDSR